MAKVPMQVMEIPGAQGLFLVVYGVLKAKTLKQKMEQGYYFHNAEGPTAFGSLKKTQKKSARVLLIERFPQHAELLGLKDEKTSK